MDRRILFSVITVILAAGVIIGRTSSKSLPVNNGNAKPPEYTDNAHLTPSKSSVQPITVVLVFDENRKEEAVVEAGTVYEALERVTAQRGMTIEKKNYDFGMMVTGVGESKNTKDYAWLYYVNGKGGEVAADRYVLKPQDRVEWRYEHLSQPQ